MSYVSNGSFKSGSAAPWKPFNLAQNVTAIVVRDPATAFTGETFLRVKTSARGGSVAVDFAAQMQILAGVAPVPGQSGGQVSGFVFPRSLCAQVWLRAQPGSAPVAGTLAFWELKLPANQVNNPNTVFTLTDKWTLVFLPIDLMGVGNTVRLEIYLDTLNKAMDVGAVSVC